MNQKLLNWLLLIFLVFLLISSPLVINFGKTGRRISLLGKDYSLLSKREIVARLETDFSLPRDLKLIDGNRILIINTADISAVIDKNKTASSLLFRRLKQGPWRYLTAFFQPKDFKLIFQINQDQLHQRLDWVAREIDRPFIPAEFYINENHQVKVNNGEIGRRVDQASLKTIILEALANYQFNQPIIIPVTNVGSLPDQNQLASSLKEAQKIIGRSVVLIGENQEIILSDDLLISWYDFNNTYKTDKISEYVDNLASSLKKEPVDAVFQFENGHVLAFRPAQKGYTLNVSQLVSLLNRRLPGLTSQTETQLRLDLPFIYSDPKVNNADVNNLGIKELIGRGSSSFKTSASYRNVNIAQGAAIVNRILVAPGETFSFNKALGKVDAESGFGKAYIIKQGRTVLDIGGGICQVSTTLFRALLNAGLNITERQAHAYRVGYYEEDMPPGYDATVFSPKPDLQFINDTDHYLLIQSLYDGVEKKLTYEIYGTSDNRKVEITNYRQWGKVPPPPDIYLDDPSLPPGKIVQDEHKVSGLKVAFDWRVTKDGKVLYQRTFTSSYVPWAAIFRRGPTSQ
ncbi:MAG TPA: VanW family protein [Candidatus Woesebacteria bacterium]|nr:VanW family protein [Candidatus Woesebacteria bacterium]